MQFLPMAASIVGGIMSSNAAGDAADSQSAAAANAAASQLQAAREANRLQWGMYQQGMANQSPYLQGGQMGMSALTGALFGAPNATTGIRAPSLNTAFSGGAPDGSITPTFTPYTQTGNVTDASGNIVTPSGAPGTPDYSVQNYGATGDQLSAAGGAFSGQLGRQFNNKDLTEQMAPNYQFQLDQGLQALKSNLAATGKLQTGQGLKDINDYAQNQASGAYQNAFNNWNTQQNNLYTRLQGLITPGAAAASNSAANAANVGSGMAGNLMSGASSANNYLTSGAAANAAGTIGSSNALTGGINGAITGWQNGNNTDLQNQLLQLQIDRARSGGGGYGGGGYGVMPPTDYGFSSGGGLGIKF
jgi:hypothetical protein